MRILFITATRIGDAVISTGVLSYLIEKHPGAEITVACGPLACSLFTHVPGIREVVALEKKPLSGHWISLWSKVASQRWDIVVDLRRSLIPFLVRTSERKRLGPDDRKRHRVEFLSTLFSLDPPRAPEIWTSPEHQAEASGLIPKGEKIIAVAPLAARPEKTWSTNNFIQLVNNLTRTNGLMAGAHVIAIGAEEDRESITELLNGLHGESSAIVGCNDLLTIYSVLSHADLIVANDSGLGHLGATTGRPTVSLFGPTEPDLYRPWGENVTVAQAPMVQGVRAINDLTVEVVHHAIGSLLNSGL